MAFKREKHFDRTEYAGRPEKCNSCVQCVEDFYTANY